MALKSDKLAGLRARVAEQPPQPQLDGAAKPRDLGGRPPNKVPTQPLNLRIPADVMRGLIEFSHERSIMENRVVTAQQIILELVRSKLAEKVSG